MTVSIDGTIKYMQQMRGRVIYSMNGSRSGADGTADCSGAVVTALCSGGKAQPTKTWIYNTEYMHDWIKSIGYVLIAENHSFNPQRGDVFIWGRRGRSSGGFGHTGIFVDTGHIIHCNYHDNGVNTTEYMDRWLGAGRPYYYIYRYGGKAVSGVGSNYSPTSTWGKLVLDGDWGRATTQASQRLYGSPVDGEVSAQYPWNNFKNAVYGFTYDTTNPAGSQIIAKFQRALGLKPDGLLGPNTIKSMQYKLGTPEDSKISKNSRMVIAMQKKLNEGVKPF